VSKPKQKRAFVASATTVRDRDLPSNGVEIAAEGRDVFLFVNGVLPGTIVQRRKFLKAVAKELNVAIYEVGHEERIATSVELDAPVNVYLFEQSDVGYHA